MMGYPQPHTQFVGRSFDITQVVERLNQDACRLLTLVGVGGIGKTRLAIEIGRKFTAQTSHPTLFVNLQPVLNSQQLPSAIADAMGVELTGSAPLEQQLFGRLGTEPLLLILDNFEQLLDRAAQTGTLAFVSDLLAQVANATLLVTSREPLGLVEEWLYPVAGLALDQSSGVESEAAQLFIRSAQRVSPRFDAPSEADGINALCELVGGMPLALELAAAWTKTLSVGEIVEALEDSAELLTTKLHNVPQRHRSIEVVINQTWDRLTEQERLAFAKLSVFQGGFQRQAAKAVADASLPTLAMLLDRSLLHWETTNRYQIHSLLRQFAEQQLGQAASSTRDAHADYFAQLARQLQDDLILGELDILHQMRAEFDNFRTAWRWALQQKNHDTTFALAVALANFLSHRNLNLEYVEMFTAAVAQTNAPSPLRAYLLRCLGQSYIRIGRIDQAATFLRESADLYSTLKIAHPQGLATDPDLYLNLVYWMRSEFEQAEQIAKRALAGAEAAGHQRNAAYAHTLLAGTYTADGRNDMAAPHAQLALEIVQRIEARDHMAAAHIAMSKIDTARGDHQSAEIHIRAAIAVRRQTQQSNGEAMALAMLGDTKRAQHAFAAAEDAYQQSLSLYRQTQDVIGEQIALRGLGQVALAQAHYEQARSRFLETIDMGLAHNLVPYTVSALVAVGELLLATGHAARGKMLLATLAHYPKLGQPARKLVENALAGEQIEVDSAEIDIFALARRTRTEIAFITLHVDSGSPDAGVTQPLVEPLTSRELEVLAHIGQGLTNRAIAEKLHLSLSTIKWYTQQIYGKLGVNSRTQSVHRARELGLIR